MTHDEYLRHDATALAERVRAGDVTASELLEIALARIGSLKPKLNAVVRLMEDARDTAKRPASSGVFPRCPFFAMTSFHCPGCGTLRALHQLFNGNLITAFGLNPLMMLSLPFVAYSFMSKLAREVRGRALPSVFVPSGWIWAFFVLVISFWVLRNIPGYPFSWLAP